MLFSPVFAASHSRAVLLGTRPNASIIPLDKPHSSRFSLTPGARSLISCISRRINTCKTPTKQTTSSTFRMNTYAKTQGVGPLRLTGNHIAPIVARQMFAPMPPSRRTLVPSAPQRYLSNGAKMTLVNGGDTVSTEAVAARRHAGTHLPVTWWKLEMPITIWHLLLN